MFRSFENDGAIVAVHTVDRRVLCGVSETPDERTQHEHPVNNKNKVMIRGRIDDKPILSFNLIDSVIINGFNFNFTNIHKFVHILSLNVFYIVQFITR